MNWKNIKNIDELTYEPWKISEKYQGFTAEIADEMGAGKLGFHCETLPPGKFSCPYHFHRQAEELFIVLSGTAILRQNNNYRQVAKGDIIHFGVTKGDAHQFYNHSVGNFTFFALSSPDENDIVEYPDSKKIYNRKLNKILRKDAEVPYMDGEENPEKYWDKQYLKNRS